jgi:hypothetical protein
VIRRKIDSELNLPTLPRLGPKMELKRGLLPWDERIKAYAIVFPGADAACVRLSQRQQLGLASESRVKSPRKGAPKSARDLPPVQFSAYFGIATTWNLLLLTFYGAVFAFLARFAWGRKLLLDYSRIFTHGVFVQGKNPSEEQLQGCTIRTTLIGRGYKSGAVMGGKPDREIVGVFSGPVGSSSSFLHRLLTSLLLLGTRLCWNTDICHLMRTPAPQGQALKGQGRGTDSCRRPHASSRFWRHRSRPETGCVRREVRNCKPR